MFCYVELHSSRKSIGHSLNVLPLYCKKKFFVFSSLGKKKKGVLTFSNTDCSSAGSLTSSQRFTVDLNEDGATLSMMSVPDG